MSVSIGLDAFSSLGYSAKRARLCSSVASLLALDSMLVNEFLIEKLERLACAFIEISLLYTISQNERQFVISIVLHTRSINGPRALLR